MRRRGNGLAEGRLLIVIGQIATVMRQTGAHCQAGVLCL